MLLIAHLSKVFHPIVLTVIFKNSKLWIVFSCHQLIYKSIASFNYFRYFFNLSFLDFFVEDLFIFSVIWTTDFFDCMVNIELFVGRWLEDNILWFFWSWHNVGNFFLRMRFKYFLYFIRLNFSINWVELRMIEESVGFILKKRENVWEKLTFAFEKSK